MTKMRNRLQIFNWKSECILQLFLSMSNTTFSCVWFLNHVDPTLTGCCHWSWYKTVLDFNRHNPLNDLSPPVTSPIPTPPNPPTAELWAQYLFFWFVYPFNPSCYIGRRQQIRRDISHQPVDTPSGGHLTPCCECLQGSESVFAVLPFLPSHVSGTAGETQPLDISDGAVTKDEHKHTHASYYSCFPRASSRWTRKILHLLKRGTSTFWGGNFCLSFFLVQVCQIVGKKKSFIKGHWN